VVFVVGKAQVLALFALLNAVGGCQVYMLPPLAVSNELSPWQSEGKVLVIVTTKGGITLMVIELVLLQPLASVPVTV
jgi:hypothetical protein